MTDHSHSSHHNERGHKHQSGHSSKKRLHHDWRFWTAVVLMLGAMGVYVATMNESMGPGGQVEVEAPADVE